MVKIVPFPGLIDLRDTKPAKSVVRSRAEAGSSHGLASDVINLSSKALGRSKNEMGGRNTNQNHTNQLLQQLLGRLNEMKPDKMAELHSVKINQALDLLIL